MSRYDVESLLANLDRAFEGKAWHGPTLLGALRSVSPRQAAVRVAPGRHTIAELVAHCAYWKYAAWRRITGEKRGSFPLAGSNWFERTESEWTGDLRLLRETHRALRAAIESLDPARLGERTRAGGWTLGEVIEGVADHDLYHAGQISLLKRLADTPERRRAGRSPRKSS